MKNTACTTFYIIEFSSCIEDGAKVKNYCDNVDKFKLQSPFVSNQLLQPDVQILLCYGFRRVLFFKSSFVHH